VRRGPWGRKQAALAPSLTSSYTLDTGTWLAKAVRRGPWGRKLTALAPTLALRYALRTWLSKAVRRGPWGRKLAALAPSLASLGNSPPVVQMTEYRHVIIYAVTMNLNSPVLNQHRYQ
jgi:hypothetical protein